MTSIPEDKEKQWRTAYYGPIVGGIFAFFSLACISSRFISCSSSARSFFFPFIVAANV